MEASTFPINIQLILSPIHKGACGARHFSLRAQASLDEGGDRHIPTPLAEAETVPQICLLISNPGSSPPAQFQLNPINPGGANQMTPDTRVAASQHPYNPVCAHGMACSGGNTLRFRETLYI